MVINEARRREESCENAESRCGHVMCSTIRLIHNEFIMHITRDNRDTNTQFVLLAFIKHLLNHSFGKRRREAF